MSAAPASWRRLTGQGRFLLLYATTAVLGGLLLVATGEAPTWGAVAFAAGLHLAALTQYDRRLHRDSSDTTG